MKKLSLLLAVAMLVSCFGAAFAEQQYFNGNTTTEYQDPTTFAKPYEVNEVIIEADEATGQVRLEAHIKDIIEVDGLKFKDLNANGELDAYEDWRLSSEERATNLLSLMDEDEKIGLLWHASTGGTFTSMYPYTEEWLYSNEPTYTDQDGSTYVPMYHSIISDHVTTYLHNVNGTPDTLIYENNAFQEIAESARLGIPVVLSCDRSYNTWAGLVNMPNYAVGIAHDEELLYDLVAQYAKEERAIGFHLPFHSYGVEIGSWYGDEVNYIAKMVGIETKAYQENGVNATTKHFVARGGRSSYSGAKSPADLLDSWLVGWKSAVIDNGSGWVMLNNGTLLNSCNVCYDSESMAVLRETLGYDGCVVTDWPMWMQSPSANGVTPEGLDLSTATLAQLYATIFNADVDQVGCFFMVEDDVPIDYDAVVARYPGMMQPMWPNEVKAAVEQGLLTWETIEKHCFRVLRNKFDLGLFEDPYSNLDDVLEMVASEEYKAGKFDLLTIEDVYRARTDEMNEMEIRLQTESAVLLRNEDVLPLAKDIKVYVDGNVKETTEMDKTALAAYATVVDELEEADVVIVHVTAMDDATELLVEDANDAEKKLVLVYDGGVSNEPGSWAVLNSDAVLFLTYDCTPDHGSSMGNIYHKTLPSVIADMLFGEKEPTGKLVFEMPWSTEDATLDWGELQLDTGVDTPTRLYMAATVRNNPSALLPNNLGDVMFTTEFGMNYTDKADIKCDTLVVPQTVESWEEEGSSGVQTKTAARDVIYAGQPFCIYFIAQNFGEGDGIVNAVVNDNGAPVAEKMIALTAGQFRVISIELVLEAGTHEIEVLGMTKTLEVR
ncbi:MAG: hypothetical protein IK127_04350 [Clostridia bacterium]|nr:hypothetical protein [Clostridia bacterium]